MGSCASKNDNATKEEGMDTFNIRVSQDMWTELDTGDEISMEPIFLDYTSPITLNWARGDNMGNAFGTTSMFNPKERNYNAVIPRLLFDLATNKVVTANVYMEYVVISHVWGDIGTIDGKPYGVDWAIPVRDKKKIDQISTVARIMGGTRYMWMDVLCLDQRQKNEQEIYTMGEYYSNARGCIVWLDNAYNDTDWRSVLLAIEEVNKKFNLDKSGIPTKPLSENLFDMRINDTDLFRLFRKVITIERSSWFKRLWTLQEGVIPDEIVFCTPERYVISGAFLFNMLSICAAGAQLSMDAGSTAGLAVIHELQRSEIWKTLRLRKLYRSSGLSYWNVRYASMTRKSHYQQDQIYGMCGLLKGQALTVDYTRTMTESNSDMYASFVNSGDFSTCCFIGNSFEDGIGMMMPMRKTEMYRISSNVLRFGNVGTDVISKVLCLMGTGQLVSWSKGMNVSVNESKDIIKAFGLPTEYEVQYSILPATFAIMSCVDLSTANALPPEMNCMGENFVDECQRCKQKALLRWLRYFKMMRSTNDTIAHVVIWAESSGPHLAAVTEIPRGRTWLVTPESYVTSPDNGCIICVEDGSGNLKRIGVCFGNGIRARSTMSNIYVKW